MVAAMTAAVAAARAHHAAQGSAILAEFASLLAMPNVSRDLPAVRANAAAIQAMLERRGVAAALLEIEGAAPVVSGRLDTAGATGTVGIYAHYDGQPVDPSEWTFGPWEPTLCTGPLSGGGTRLPMPGPGDEIDPGWRLYARSAADDKAPVVAAVAALDALASAGLVPTRNIVFLFEGEEEIGSGHLAAYLASYRDRFAADLWLVCDGPVHATGRPQVVFGVRGITEMEITVYGAEHDPHSGHDGMTASLVESQVPMKVTTRKAVPTTPNPALQTRNRRSRLTPGAERTRRTPCRDRFGRRDAGSSETERPNTPSRRE